MTTETKVYVMLASPKGNPDEFKIYRVAAASAKEAEAMVRRYEPDEDLIFRSAVALSNRDGLTEGICNT